ncbi:MAG: LCP family protein [Micromonosporaceae bacterium]|nr:LCP family protein [Micromonosporaceae bacterium]
MPEQPPPWETVGVVDQQPHPAEPAETPERAARSRRRRRRRTVLLTLLIVFVVLVGGASLGGWLYLRSVETSISRVDAFSQIPQQSRPQKVVTDAENMLILGSDSRDPESTAGSRTDTIILAHLPKDRASAQLVSIPRDTLVHIPRSPDGKHGSVNDKINAAYAWGGVPLVVETVEAFTGVRIDHVVLVDFGGFKEIIDALGGVDIYVDQSFTSQYGFNGPRTFKKGLQHMDGAAALDYSHERHAFADGDFARIRHQQQMIKAVLDKAASAGLLTNPARLNSFLRATAKAVSVDQTMSIVDTAMQLRQLRSGNLTFFTSPSSGTGMVAGQSMVFANTAKAKTLYDAIRRDNVPQILSSASAG